MSKRQILFASLTLVSLSFLVFTIWIIHEANIGRDNILFQTVRATPYGDKIGHILLAGSLTLVANFLCKHRVLRLAQALIPYGSLIVLAIAILEEASQYFLSTRSFDVVDGLANLIGILLCSIPAILIAKRKQA